MSFWVLCYSLASRTGEGHGGGSSPLSGSRLMKFAAGGFGRELLIQDGAVLWRDEGQASLVLVVMSQPAGYFGAGRPVVRRAVAAPVCMAVMASPLSDGARFQSSEASTTRTRGNTPTFLSAVLKQLARWRRGAV